MPALQEPSDHPQQDVAQPEWTAPKMTVLSVAQTLNSGTSTSDGSTQLLNS